MADTFGGRASQAVEGLAPGYFAIVMASGIISVGMKLKEFELVSTLLLGVSAVSYVVLVGLNGWRIASCGPAMRCDFSSPQRAFGFFTFVAGTNVFGVRLGMDGHDRATAGLLAVAGGSWLVLGYVIPWTAVLRATQRRSVEAANGSWFIWVVASQSVAIAAATVEPVFHDGRSELAVLAVASWSVGVFLYALVGVVVLLRLITCELRPEDLTPPYWVSMGALAITVLSGARIVEMADAPMVDVTRGLIAGSSVVFWAFASWLIPVLVAAGWWRHGRGRVPLRYDNSMWSVIFPLGMYAVAGIYLGEADHLPIVGLIGSWELWIAFTGWSVVLVAMTVHVMCTVVIPSPTARTRATQSPGP